MSKLLKALLSILLTSSCAFADTFGGSFVDFGPRTAYEILTNKNKFTGFLSASDTNVQQALETLSFTAASSPSVTGNWNFGEGNLELPNNTTCPVAACNETSEAGRVCIDTDATSGQQVYGCEGATGWILQGDGGGAGGGDNIRINAVAATDANFSDSTPAIPASAVAVKWQRDSQAFNNISAFVGFSSPLTKSAEILSIQNSTSSQAGALTAADWITFNNKLSRLDIDSSTEMYNILVDKTGTGGLMMFNNSPSASSLTVTNAASIFTVETTNLIGSFYGGTGLNSMGATGVPRVSGGTWTLNAGIGHLNTSTSANLAAVISDETGTGAAVFGTSPTITTSLAQDGDVADAGYLRLQNAAIVGWEASPAGTDVTLTVDATEIMQVSGALNAGGAITESTINVLNNDEIDASSELLAIMDDETGTGVLVFGTSPTFTTSIVIPNGANPTTDAAGKVAVDTSATSGSALRFYGDAAYTLPAWQRVSFILNTPTAASDFEVGSFPANITIKQIRVLSVGGTNVVGGLQECDANGGTCSAVDADITASAGTTATDDGTLTNGTIDANDQLQWLTTSISGSPTRAVVTIYYTYDQVN